MPGDLRRGTGDTEWRKDERSVVISSKLRRKGGELARVCSEYLEWSAIWKEIVNDGNWRQGTEGKAKGRVMIKSTK